MPVCGTCAKVVLANYKGCSVFEPRVVMAKRAGMQQFGNRTMTPLRWNIYLVARNEECFDHTMFRSPVQILAVRVISHSLVVYRLMFKDGEIVSDISMTSVLFSNLTCDSLRNSIPVASPTKWRNAIDQSIAV